MLLNPAAIQPGPGDDFWYQPVSGAGPYISQLGGGSQAERIAAVHACCRLIAQSQAMLPFHAHRRLADGSERAPDHPLDAILNRAPNGRMSSFEFKRTLTYSAVMRGNGYAQIIGGARGEVEQLVPLHPDRVKAELLPTGRVRYEVTEDNGARHFLPQEEIFHLRGISTDGLLGVDPLTWFRVQFGLAASAEDYARRFFDNDTQTAIALMHDGSPNPEQREEFKRSWQSAQAGANRHKAAVLWGGWKIQNLGVEPRNAQMLESRKLSVTEIARIFGVPPHLIADLDRATFSNIEHQGLEFVIYSLMPWLVAWEQAVARQLIGEPDIYAEHNVSALLRGDTKTRYETYAIAINWGIMSPNDARRLENMNPRENGDTYLQPVNMAPSGFVPLGPARGNGAGALEGEIVPRLLRGVQPLASAPLPNPPPEGAETGTAGLADSRGEGVGGREAFAPLLADAARRIASWEDTRLQPRAEKAAGDPERWSAWLRGGFEPRLAEAAFDMLAPVLSAMGAGHLAPGIAAELALSARQDQEAAPRSGEKWKAERIPVILALIQEELSHDRAA